MLTTECRIRFLKNNLSARRGQKHSPLQLQHVRLLYSAVKTVKNNKVTGEVRYFPQERENQSYRTWMIVESQLNNRIGTGVS